MTSTIKMINILNKKKIKDFQYFLFISSSHVYGFSNKKIKETKKRIIEYLNNWSVLIEEKIKIINIPIHI